MSRYGNRKPGEYHCELCGKWTSHRCPGPNTICGECIKTEPGARLAYYKILNIRLYHKEIKKQLKK
jgi:hypothetical protein